MAINNDWASNNKKYWASIAPNYSSIYTDKWSLLENDFILGRIRYTQSHLFKNVLDLGCGIGLGYKLCSSLNPNINYTGIDISIEMLDVLHKIYPNITTFNSSMSDLQRFHSKSYDSVISIFTAFSYTDDLEKTINEVTRVLNRNGTILISVISKYSLRRIFKFKFGKKEKYKTRHFTSTGFSYSWVFSKFELYRLFEKDFSNIEIIGYNSFGGLPFLAKHTTLWRINLFIAKLFPNLSHELILTAVKK